jgi:hypothetical protein
MRRHRPTPTQPRRRLAAALVAAFVLSGCGSTSAKGPRDALSALLTALASDNAAGACRTLTPAAAELRRGFGGSTCLRTLTTAVGYVAVRTGEPAAIRHATVLPTLDVPLSPAPYRDGASTTSLRVSFHDPVLGEHQEFDVGLRRADGVWRVDSGIAALFTLLGSGT